VDGQLDLLKNLEIEQHLQECATCANEHRAIQAVRASIRSEAPYYAPPSALHARIRTALRSASRAGPAAQPRRAHWLALAASLLFVVIAGWSLFSLLGPRAGNSRLTEELVASHVRSQMLPNHRVDVESSNQHTVKPWFEGKLDFSPAVQDLTSEGFPLAGGRLDYLDHRPVAALVYHRHKHLINLFIWPSAPSAEASLERSTRQGYHLFHWTQSGMNYWTVSDLNESELTEFVGLIKDGTR
jgi:anti-sigma factor RsiW